MTVTQAERSIVSLAQGLTNREAAARLFLSHHTVGFHLRSIYRKLGVSPRVEVTPLALEHHMAGSEADRWSRRPRRPGQAVPRALIGRHGDRNRPFDTVFGFATAAIMAGAALALVVTSLAGG